MSIRSRKHYKSSHLALLIAAALRRRNEISA